MGRVPLWSLLSALLLLTFTPTSDATLQRLLRRQSEEEGTNAASAAGANQQSNGKPQQQLPPRLYPDLPRQQPFLAPPFASGPTPFVPFGLQPTNGRLMQQPLGHLSDTDRLRSQTFTNGLGKRLLSMVGIESPPSELNSNRTSEVIEGLEMSDPNMIKALSNSTILQQLNTGLQSIYGGLSKMYNSTVQQQLEMLRDRFQREAGNSTNPWQQRMAQQVPLFFQRMAMKVNQAQQSLNQVLSQMVRVRNGSMAEMPPTTAGGMPDLGVGQFFSGNPDDPFGAMGNNGNNFFNQIGRSFGIMPPLDGQQQQQPMDLRMRLMDFWHNQVQPQMGMIQNQVARVWRDLTQSGALAPMNNLRNRFRNQTTSSEGAPLELVDSILKEADMNSPEYKLVEPVDNAASEEQRQQSAILKDGMNAQMQNRLISMQKELNHLWNGLSSSLQSALGNVRRSLNQNPSMGPSNSVANNDNNKEIDDQAANEISAKIKDLNKVQKDADVVYDVVQQQQQARPTFVDRFRHFIGNMNFDDVDQFSNRVGEQVIRLGNAVGDIWHHIPERWDNLMQNVRHQDPPLRLMAQPSVSTTKRPEVLITNS